MRKVVVNTTPLLALSEIGKLSLLKELYGEICIPEAVYEEIKTEPACTEVRDASEWIHIVSVKDMSPKRMFQARLHAGEVEVLMYALESKADLVILDDKLARKTATYMGLTITGTVGLLIKAKETGYLNEVKPVMEKLIQNGLFVSPEVQKMVLEMVNEN
jgi:predicted nucleic acid-binding protein